MIGLGNKSGSITNLFCLCRNQIKIMASQAADAALPSVFQLSVDAEGHNYEECIKDPCVHCLYNHEWLWAVKKNQYPRLGLSDLYTWLQKTYVGCEVAAIEFDSDWEEREGGVYLSFYLDSNYGYLFEKFIVFML